MPTRPKLAFLSSIDEAVLNILNGTASYERSALPTYAEHAALPRVLTLLVEPEAEVRQRATYFLLRNYTNLYGPKNALADVLSYLDPNGMLDYLFANMIHDDDSLSWLRTRLNSLGEQLLPAISERLDAYRKAADEAENSDENSRVAMYRYRVQRDFERRADTFIPDLIEPLISQSAAQAILLELPLTRKTLKLIQAHHLIAHIPRLRTAVENNELHYDDPADMIEILIALNDHEYVTNLAINNTTIHDHKSLSILTEHLGRSGNAYLSILESRYENRDTSKESVINALQRIGTPEAITLLHKFNNQPDNYHKNAIALALIALGQEGDWDVIWSQASSHHYEKENKALDIILSHASAEQIAAHLPKLNSDFDALLLKRLGAWPERYQNTIALLADAIKTAHVTSNETLFSRLVQLLIAAPGTSALPALTEIAKTRPRRGHFASAMKACENVPLL